MERTAHEASHGDKARAAPVGLTAKGGDAATRGARPRVLGANETVGREKKQENKDRAPGAGSAKGIQRLLTLLGKQKIITTHKTKSNPNQRQKQISKRRETYFLLHR